MIRFEINGEYLDLPEGFSLQFKKTNILFGFDDIECERSTAFDIPATPNNDRIFLLAKWIQSSGVGMRRRYDGQMQDGIITKNGYLYVSSFAKGIYKAVFVTGEMFGLKVIKDAGKIAEIISPSEIATYGSVTRAFVGKGYVYDGIKYQIDSDEFIIPSIRIHTLIERVLQTLDVTYSLPSASQYVRYVPSSVSGVLSQNVQMYARSRQLVSDGTYPTCYDVQISEISTVLTTTTAKVQRREDIGGITIYRGTVRQLQAKQALKITFPTNWNDDLYIVEFLDADTYYLSVNFYGNRSFNQFGTPSGESLRGRSVDIPQGSNFAIIDVSSYVYEVGSGGTTQGWDFGAGDTHYNFMIEGGEMEALATIRMKDNLPDVTVIELLKILSALNGLQLYYTDAAGVTFEALNFETWPVFDFSNKVVETQDLERRFGDYAQNNYVQFKDEDAVPSAERVRMNYTIDNVNIENTKVLQQIPYSEALTAAVYGDRSVAKIPNGIEAIADADTAGDDMVRARLIKNANIQKLCNACTSISIRVYISYLEYESITPKTLLYYNGVRYVWTSSNWSKGIATFKISKIDA